MSQPGTGQILRVATSKTCWRAAFVLSISAFAHSQNSALGAANTISADSVRASMRFLSDSLLEGRGTATRGHAIAARYVATQLESMGVQPAGEGNSYFQTVPLRKSVNQGPGSSVCLIAKNKKLDLRSELDCAFDADLTRAEVSLEASIVFVGFGVSAPELGYDDYSGIDARGKVVAMLSNAPARFPSSERAHYSSASVKSRNAVVHGAVGLMMLTTQEDEKNFPWAWYLPQLQAGTWQWREKDGLPHEAFSELKASVELSPEGARKLFEGSPRSLQQIFTDAEGGKLQAFPLPWSLQAHSVGVLQDLESQNVVGIVRGSDPKLKNELVVYTSHIDHLGLCPPVKGSTDNVCHGAVDNASGVAVLLEIARAYRNLPHPPRRSILFAFVTGEEVGLLGSDYFVHFPTLPINQIVADVTLDFAPAILYPSKDLTASGVEHSTLSENVQAAARSIGYTVTPDYMPEQNVFIRSDHYSFVKQGIPALFFLQGADGADVEKEFLSTRYHTPLDNLEQPLHYEDAAKAARVVFLTGYGVAQQDQRPRWNPNDFFGDRFGGMHPAGSWKRRIGTESE